MKKQSIIMLIIFLAALIPAAPVEAQEPELTEVIITPDGTAGLDTYMSSTNAYTNYGTADTMLIGETTSDETGRVLINFDMSTLPADAEIASATLSLYVASDLADNAPTVEVYPVLRDWVEGAAWWSRWSECVNCWWTTPQWSNAWEVYGATGETDIMDEVIGTASLANNLTAETKVDITLDPVYVGHFLRENYYGMLIKTSSEANDAYSFYTSDATNSAFRPTLTIEYDPSPEVTDPGWFCVDGYLIECEPYMDPEVSITPYFVATADSPTPNSYGGGPWEGNDTSIAVGGKIDCEPYPQCRNDYPIYYRITYAYEWTSQFQDNVWATTALRVASGTDTVIDYESPRCEADFGSNGTIGHCKGIMVGIIYPEQMPAFPSSDYDVYVKTHIVFSTGYPVSSGVMFSMYLSRVMPEETCSDTYVTPVPYDFEIDPTIETPVGMVGDETPTDEQGYPLTPDVMYMLKIEGGPWNDGTDDRTDTAVSFDGTTFMNLQEFIFSENVLCYDISPLDENWITVYFTAETEAVYIRVNDTEGEEPSEFADNTITDPESPLIYIIAEAFISDSSCPGFVYSQEDVVASIEVPSTDSDVEVYDGAWTPPSPVVGGQWYGIKVVNGTWHEDSPTTERIDMEFNFLVFGPQQNPPPWAPLAEGSPLVSCVSVDGTMVFVQAPLDEGIVLHLRVNDQDTPQNWLDNTGTLDVDIYHVTNIHSPSGCEEDYNIDDLVFSGDTNGDQTGGEGFGNSFGSLDGFGNTVPGGVSTSYYMTPGGWYMLETRDGPWYASSSSGGDFVAGRGYYSIQLSRWSSDFEEDWASPETWEVSACVVSIDMLGHQRIYFQVPDNTEYGPNESGVEFMIRVAGASNSTDGLIGWDLYQAVDNTTEGNPWNSCVSDYGTTEFYLNQAWIPVKAEEGAVITQKVTTGGGMVALEPGITYRLDTGNGPWTDGEEPPGEFYTAQMSNDNGTTWFSIGEHADITCASTDQLGKYETAIFTVTAGQVWRIRVADTDSEMFLDNGGTLSYKLSKVVYAPGGVTDDDNNYFYNDADFDACQPSLIRPVFVDTSELPEYTSPTLPETWDVSDWVAYLGEWFGSLTSYVGDSAGFISDYWGSVGDYLGGWSNYISRSLQTYFAWCPRHTNVLIVEFWKLREKEPLASVYEIESASDSTIAEIKSYDWGPGGEGGGIAGEDYEDTSIFSFGEGGGSGESPDTVNNIIDKIFPQSGRFNEVWDGGDLVDFSETDGTPEFYDTCNDVFGDFLPSRLRMGVCFASSWWKETGAAWWIQLSLDISTVFMLLLMIKGAAQSLIYMMTGVRPWTKDGAMKVIVNTAEQFKPEYTEEVVDLGNGYGEIRKRRIR